MIRRQFLAALAAAPAALVLPRAVQAGDLAICSEDGIAIRGADAVAYFTDGAHLPGRPEHALMWRGAVWLFDRAETRLAFEMDPVAFCPQFGGFCANALSHGMVSKGDPRAWMMQDGGLYLCSSPLAMIQFRRDVTGNLAAARANWPAVLGG